MPTLRTYRRRVAYELGPFFHSTVTGGTTSTLVDSKWPLYSTIVQTETYQDWWVYRPDAATSTDKERTVKTYAPLTGTLNVDHAYTVAPASGEVYELHPTVQPSKINENINQGLKRLLIPIEFTFTPTDDAIRHSLATPASWLTNTEWVRQLGYLTTTEVAEGRGENDPYIRGLRGEVTSDGATVYIEHRGHTFDGTETVYVRAMKPAYNQCRVSAGTWGAQSGLTLETDEAVPTEEWVASAALVEIWRTLSQVLEAASNSKLLLNRQECAQWLSAETVKNYKEWPKTFRRLVAFGPRW